MVEHTGIDVLVVSKDEQILASLVRGVMPSITILTCDNTTDLGRLTAYERATSQVNASYADGNHHRRHAERTR